MSATTEFHAEAATVSDGQVTTLPWRTLGSRRLITRSGAAVLLAAFVLAGPRLFTWAGPAAAMNFGLTVAMLVLAVLLAFGLAGPTQKIGPARMTEEEAWSDLAAVMEESIHGQDDVRTSLARPYVLRLYAQRASRVLARGRVVWKMSAWVGAVASGVMSLAEGERF